MRDSTAPTGEPIRISRSKVELFLECPRCFYLDKVRGVTRPDFASYSLNLAVDHLLKKEFDMYRLSEKAHPLMSLYGVEAVPFKHRDMDTWRTKGIDAVHDGLFLFGIVDDVWKHDDGTLAIVDYKATSTGAAITLDGDYRAGYKRQLEFYQWLFRHNGFDVSDTGYFVFVNADKEKDTFDKKLEFTPQILPYEGKGEWIEDALIAIKECLESDVPPPSSSDCKWCAYRKKAHIQE